METITHSKKRDSFRVAAVHINKEWDEGLPEEGGDGYWIMLKPGWKWTGDVLGAVHAIHEATRKRAHMERVMRCDCEDCSREG